MEKGTNAFCVLYLVLTIETFGGDEWKFFTDTKLFSNINDAENYFNEQDQEFCRDHATINEVLETEYDFQEEKHDDYLHEYWWNGSSHRRSEIMAIMPK